MHRIVVTKKKPVYVSENLALRPATQNSKLIRMIYKRLASLNDTRKNFFLCLSSIDYFSAHSELKQDVNNYARSLKGRLNIDSRKILKLTSGTGLFSLNIAYVMDQRNYPSHIKLYVEPEVMIRGVVRQLDYAIVDHRDPANVLVLAEVKRITTTHNLGDYVRNSFEVFKEIQKGSQNYFSNNKFLVLHIHLSPTISRETKLYEALKALDAVSVFANVRVIVSRGGDVNQFEGDLVPFLDEIIYHQYFT